MKIINKTHGALPVQFRLDGIGGKVVVLGAKEFIVPGDQLAETSVLVELDPGQLASSTTQLAIGVYAGGKRIETVKTAFIGPRH